MKKGPVYHSSHRKEHNSKRNFEKLIEPCVVNWTERDYGVDGLVTLYDREMPNGNAELDALHFLVQLKSTKIITANAKSFSFALESNKIRDYVKSNVSVLLVVNDLSNSCFYCIWINNEFVNALTQSNPDWNTKKKVSIKFSSKEKLTDKFVQTCRSYLQSRRVNQVTVLPGQYFAMRDQVKSLLNTFRAISAPFGFESTIKSIDVLFEKIELAIYRIAVAGPSRAGKSTLINALLKKSISPIGIYQTTGVPIQIVPGSKDEIIVYYKDNTKHVEKFSLTSIARYVSQTEDLKTIKNIKFVSVSIVNSSLEKGISIFDVPGLDDPDDEILQNTLSYVKTFNAIIYLIDVSPHKTGGFAFKSEFKRQLEEMTSRLDKVFLVFNKIDSLSNEELESLKTRVAYDLKRLGLAEKVDSKISYVSAKESLEASLSGKEHSENSLVNLEKSLWSYLLEGDKAGIYRLLDVTKEIYKGYNEFTDILNTRLMDSENLERLHTAIGEIRNKLPELKKMLVTKGRSTNEKVNLFLESEKHDLLLKLEKLLKAIPLNQSFPSDKDLKKFLVSEIEASITKANSICLEQINLYKDDVDIWIESNLKKIREIISSNTQTKIPDLSPIESMSIPSIDLSAAFGMGVLGGIIAFIINPYAAVGTIIVSAATAFFGLLFFTQETRRARRISKVVESTRAKCDEVFSDLKLKFSQGSNEIFITVHNYADQKLSLYFSDMNAQISRIKTHRLTDQDKVDYQSCFEKLKIQATELERMVSELTLYK